MPVYKDSKTGNWYFSFHFDGKRILKRKWNGEPMTTKKIALLCEQECKNTISGKVVYLYDLYDEYIKSTKSVLKESTKNNYDKFRKNYLSLIPNQDIKDLTIKKISSWRDDIGSIDATAKYKNRMLNIMARTLNYGSIAYDIKGNLQLPLLEPFKDNEIKDFNDKTKYLPPNDFELFIEPLNTDKFNYYYYYTILHTLYWSGLRIGELAALNVEDYKNETLYVNKTYVRVGGKDYVQTPKTTNSIRKVKLDKKSCSIINRYIELYNPTRVLFVLQGEYINQQKLRRIIKRLSGDSKFNKYQITPHTLRHSHASYLRSELGYDEFTISKRLGNTPQVSANTYIHTSEDDDLDIVEKINKKNKGGN